MFGKPSVVSPLRTSLVRIGLAAAPKHGRPVQGLGPASGHRAHMARLAKRDPDASPRPVMAQARCNSPEITRLREVIEMLLIVTPRSRGSRRRPQRVMTRTCRCLDGPVVRARDRRPLGTTPGPGAPAREMVNYRDGIVAHYRHQGMCAGLAPASAWCPQAGQVGQTRGWHRVDLPVELERRSHTSVLRRHHRSGLGQLSAVVPMPSPTESERLMRQSRRHTDRLRAVRCIREVHRHPVTLLKGA